MKRLSLKRLSLALICITLWLAIGRAAAFAQEQPPGLIVTLRDVQGAPLGGATVIVRDGSGTYELSRAMTDARGVAGFNLLTKSQVRVAIIGTLPNGTKLYQPGDDAQGITLLLDPASTVLDLRSESDGMVIPDPATMAALELGVPVVMASAGVPATPRAARVPVAHAAPELVGRAPLVPVEKPAEIRRGHVWLGMGLLIALVGAAVGIVVIQRRSA